MKKRLIITAAIAALLLAGGCSGGTKKTDTDGSVVIDWVGQCDSPVDSKSDIIAELEQKHGVKFNFIYLDRSKMDELMNIRIASGEIPDVFSVTSDSRYRELIDQSVLSEIPEDKLKSAAPELYKQTALEAGDDIWTAAKQDGKIYGLPKLNYNGKYHYVPIWRDDWLKNVGIDKIPETVDEAEEAFYRFVKNDPDRNGVDDTYGMSINGIKAILNAYGAHPLGYYWMKYNGKIEMSAVIPEMKEALTRLNKWYNDGIIDPEFITGENNGGHFANAASFYNGRIGFSNPGLPYHICPGFDDKDTGVSSNYTQFKAILGENATYTWGKPLVGPAGKSGAEHWGVFAGDYVVTGRNVANDENKLDKILEIFESQCTDFDEYILCKYGKEGRDWESSNGAYTKLIEPRERQALGLEANGVQILANNFDYYEKTLLPKQLEYYEETGTNADLEHYSQAVWGALPSDTQYKSAVQRNIEENYYAFISGARSIDEFDKWVEELNRAGLDTLRKEANEWYIEKYGKIE